MTVAMIHLASKSPRRRALLDQIGVDYAIVDAPIDEIRTDGEPPRRFAERMACEKARAGLAALGDSRIAPVLAADTVVVLEDRVLGKPRDEAHAMEMLRALSGRMHRVISAVAVAGIHVGGTGKRQNAAKDGGFAGISAGDALRVAASVSRVWFREIPHEECRAYCASGEPLDKAGAYAIQGHAAIFVARLDGSYSGVMGLPLFETAALLRETGIGVRAPQAHPASPDRYTAPDFSPGDADHGPQPIGTSHSGETVRPQPRPWRAR